MVPAFYSAGTLQAYAPNSPGATALIVILGALGIGPAWMAHILLADSLSRVIQGRSELGNGVSGTVMRRMGWAAILTLILLAIGSAAIAKAH